MMSTSSRSSVLVLTTLCSLVACRGQNACERLAQGSSPPPAERPVLADVREVRLTLRETYENAEAQPVAKVVERVFGAAGRAKEALAIAATDDDSGLRDAAETALRALK